MTERRESGPKPSQHDVLKRELIDSKLAPGAFLDALESLEDDPDGRFTRANIDLLTNAEVRGLLLSENGFDYHNLLSRAYLHSGKRHELSGDAESASSAYLNAIREAEVAGGDEAYREWVEYLKSRIAYIENDTETLREIKGRVQGENRNIVESMIREIEEKK